MPSLAKELEKSIKRERYLSFEQRSSASKTIPVGGGRTADDLIQWPSFSDEVVEFWQDVRPRLEAVHVPSHRNPQRAYPTENRVRIRDESEVRGACHVCIFGIVNRAAEELGWKIRINATSSTSCAKSNVDVAAFVISQVEKGSFNQGSSGSSTSSSDSSSNISTDEGSISIDDDDAIEIAVALPIEVKGPWQFQCKGWQHVVDAFETEAGRNDMKRCLAQVYYYMVTEEVQYAALGSKEEHIFFCRNSDPSNKTLCVSKVMKHSDLNPSVRLCYLFMLFKAKEGDTVNASQVPITQPSQKWIPIARSALPSDRGGRGISRRQLQIGADRNMGNGGRRRSGSCYEQVCSIRCTDTNVQWLLGLMETELQSLNLGEVLKKGSRCIVRAGNIRGVDVCIKIYEFFETYEHLNVFKAEVDAYELLWSLQGLDVPVLMSYGTTWDRCVGFLAIRREGLSLSIKDASSPGLVNELVAAFSRLHDYKVLHNDVTMDNIVHSSPANVQHPFKIIDFGSSVLYARSDAIAREHDNVISLCKGYNRERKAKFKANLKKRRL